MRKSKIYSPEQVGIGSFVGGPGAAIYFLWANFKALGQSAQVKYTLIWGGVLNVALLLLLPFLPAKFPPYIIPLAYSLAARFLAGTYQLKKEAIAGSEQYDFQSNWKVTGIALLLLVVWVVVAICAYLALEAIGVLSLPN